MKKFKRWRKYISLEQREKAINADVSNKIKVDVCYIIVDSCTKSLDKPYYSILYHEIGSEVYNIGYSSHNLAQVVYWQNTMFDIIGGDYE